MQVEEKIRKVGNSVVITVLQDFLERANIHVGEMVGVNNDAWDLLIKKKSVEKMKLLFIQKNRFRNMKWPIKN